MEKDSMKNLGKVTKRHVSGMMETDKGNKFPAHGNAEIGDQLVQIGRKKIFMKKDAFAEIGKSKKPKYQKGVTTALRAEAEALEVEVFETTTKDELLEAIESAKNEQMVGGDE